MQHFTFIADFHLLAPALLRLAPTDRAVDAPTHMPGTELPRRAILPRPLGAFFDHPTRAIAASAGVF